MTAGNIDLGQEFDDLYGYDAQTEADGAWMDVPGKPGWAVRLRSGKAPKVENKAQELMRRHLPLLSVGRDIPASSRVRDEIELLATAIVVDWKGFNSLPCTPDNVRAVMAQYPTFREMCMRWSETRKNYRQQEADEMGKASVELSDASSSSGVTSIS